MQIVHQAWPVSTSTVLIHVLVFVVSMPSVESSTMHQRAHVIQDIVEILLQHVHSYHRQLNQLLWKTHVTPTLVDQIPTHLGTLEALVTVLVFLK